MKNIIQREGWFHLDQHYDPSSLLAHKHTAAEIVDSLPDVKHVVCATGTGATAAGLRKYLPYYIKVHSRPSMSGSIDGIADVRRYQNFCNSSSLEGYENGLFCPQNAVESSQYLKNVHGIHAGPSTGACFNLAKTISKQFPQQQILVISADGFQFS